ncbi:MAG TPA: DUF4388 domain-containing protein [Syntrophales bacterium]|nr:DUF4388 domain-containing protein [Syntrophales bacterium]
MKNIKLVVKNDSISEDSEELKEGSQVWPMVGLSVGSFIQLISMDQQTCILEVYHSVDKKGAFYFVEGSLYNAICGDLEGEEAAMEMISWEKVRININSNLNTNDVARKIQKGLMSLLMESSRRKDESDWDHDLKGSDEIAGKDENDPSAMAVLDNEEKNSAEDRFKLKLDECMEICRRDIGKALISVSVISMTNGKALGEYNSDPETVILFNEITNFMKGILEKSSPEALGKYYIVDLLKDNKMLFSLLCGKYEYQWGIVFDSTEVQLGLLLNVIIPKITKLFEDAISIRGHGSSIG